MPQIKPLLPWKTQAAHLHICKSVGQLRPSYLDEEEVRGAEPQRRSRSGGEHSVRHLERLVTPATTSLDLAVSLLRYAKGGAVCSHGRPNS